METIDHSAESGNILKKIQFLTGSAELLQAAEKAPAREIFDPEILDFLASLSKELMADPRSRQYSDVVTFAFWIRNASLKQLKERYGETGEKLGGISLGRGMVFHIAPSNVPVNFAYSLVAGLLAGNANVVRVPSKDFPQVQIIAEAINNIFGANTARSFREADKGVREDGKEHETHEAYDMLRPYINLIRYERDKEINDMLSAMASVRIIWGGDQTIAELRKSPLPPRSTEITFADRYSLAVIDSEAYLVAEDKKRIANDFYNDTYFSDQNACTSPRLVAWMGEKKAEAKELFWKELYALVKEKYGFQDIQGVNKLTAACLTAIDEEGAKVLPHEDNLLIRVFLPKATASCMKHMENSGFFFETDCDDILELKDVCNSTKCQTVGVLGDKSMLLPLVESGIKGIDRVVPIGNTMDFDLIWDGYDLIRQLSRRVMI